jgi:hypothetical protein
MDNEPSEKEKSMAKRIVSGSTDYTCDGLSCEKVDCEDLKCIGMNKPKEVA